MRVMNELIAAVAMTVVAGMSGAQGGEPPRGLPALKLPEGFHAEVAAGTPVVQALVDTGLVASLSEARRAIAQGGVSLDAAKVEDEDAVVTGALPGGVSVLRRGKKTLAGLFVG